MKKQDVGNREARRAARPLARMAARELSQADLKAVAGGVIHTTHATGANGDDPADPDWDA